MIINRRLVYKTRHNFVFHTNFSRFQLDKKDKQANLVLEATRDDRLRQFERKRSRARFYEKKLSFSLIIRRFLFLQTSFCRTRDCHSCKNRWQ